MNLTNTKPTLFLNNCVSKSVKLRRINRLFTNVRNVTRDGPRLIRQETQILPIKRGKKKTLTTSIY